MYQENKSLRLFSGFTKGQHLEDGPYKNKCNFPCSSNRTVFQSHLPRPAAIVRSGSSSSSTSGKDKSTVETNTNISKENTSRLKGDNITANYTSDDNSSSNAEEEENLLASFLNSGISKSKSEPLNLKSSAYNNKANCIW